MNILRWVVVSFLGFIGLWAVLMPLSWVLVEVVLERFVAPVLDWSLDGSPFFRGPLAITWAVTVMLAWAVVVAGVLLGMGGLVYLIAKGIGL